MEPITRCSIRINGQYMRQMDGPLIIYSSSPVAKHGLVFSLIDPTFNVGRQFMSVHNQSLESQHFQRARDTTNKQKCKAYLDVAQAR